MGAGTKHEHLQLPCILTHPHTFWPIQQLIAPSVPREEQRITNGQQVEIERDLTASSQRAGQDVGVN